MAAEQPILDAKNVEPILVDMTRRARVVGSISAKQAVQLITLVRRLLVKNQALRRQLVELRNGR